jgi:hypothetical protein
MILVACHTCLSIFYLACSAFKYLPTLDTLLSSNTLARLLPECCRIRAPYSLLTMASKHPLGICFYQHVFLDFILSVASACSKVTSRLKI